MFKLDEFRVTKLAQELPNERLTPEQWEDKANLGRLQYIADFRARATAGGSLSFLEAKNVVRENLTWDKWKITFYEMVQFPQMRFFETEAEAMEYFRKATEERSGLRPARMEVCGPKGAAFGKRPQGINWKAEGYKPDPMTFKYR